MSFALPSAPAASDAPLPPQAGTSSTLPGPTAKGPIATKAGLPYSLPHMSSSKDEVVGGLIDASVRDALSSELNGSTAAPAAHGTSATSSTSITPTLQKVHYNNFDHPQNIVATTDLSVRLDLKTIALHARNAEYNPKRFAAVIMRIREPKTTALIFASGKMVVTGAKSEDESRLASRKYVRIIQKLGFSAEFNEFKVQNIVGSTDVRFPIRLEGLAYAHGAFSSYEPELFPGLIYRMVKPKVVLLIFVSGKVVLTGAKHREDIQAAFDNIYPVLRDFRKPN